MSQGLEINIQATGRISYDKFSYIEDPACHLDMSRGVEYCNIHVSVLLRKYKSEVALNYICGETLPVFFNIKLCIIKVHCCVQYCKIHSSVFTRSFCRIPIQKVVSYVRIFCSNS